MPADPSLSVARQIDELADRFEQQWRAGARPRLEDYLAALPAAIHEDLLRALIPVEIELRAREGKRLGEGDYHRRFHGHGNLISGIFAEISARRSGAGETSVSRESARTGPLSSSPPAPPRIGPEPLLKNVGRFPVLGVLGEGAFGRVYRAKDPQLGREVAIKVPFDAAVQTEADRARFLREARAAAGIHHPNVCPVHEVGESDGKPYIVMALIPGQSLAAVIKSRKEPLPDKQVAVIVRKLALALDAAHKKGVVHRDLKPANVMFDKERKDVVVTDFGLARGPQLGDGQATQSGVIMGSPAYMSPEQARGESKSVGPAADIYALGVILYELLAGKRPFGGSITEVIGQILHVEPERPSKYRPTIDQRLEVASLKAMAKDPAARFASMKEFASAMDAVLRAPGGSTAETAKATETRGDADSSMGTDTRRLADIFAAYSAEQKGHTEAAVEAAVKKARTPRWVFVLFGVLLVGGLTALGGIIFFAKTKSVTVLINVDVDLSDKTLSFFLDGKPISAEELAKPVELTLGEHELVVKRGDDVVKRILFGVRGGNNPSIEVREVQEKAPTVPPKKNAEDGFVPLFNGKDLSGWRVIRTLRPPQTPLKAPEGWAVRDGALTCTTQEFLWLRTDREYGDFVLKLECKLPVGGANTGIYLRNPGAAESGLDGFHVQIVPDRTPANKTWPPTWRAGGIWNVVAPKVDAMRPPGEWNDIEIHCDAAKVRVVLNGKITVDLDVNDHKELKDRPRSGFIGLANFQGEGKGAAFRNIRIKERAPTAEQGFVPLFNGKDLAGWKTHESQPGDWKAKDGTLLVGPGLSHLYTERDDYKNFHFRMDVRTNDGNTGVMYRAPFGPTLGIKKEWVAGYNAKLDTRRMGGIIVDMDPRLHRVREIGIKAGEWTRFEIIAQGDRHIVKLNGETTADYTDPNSRYRSGHLVLQQHSGRSTVEFRNLEIKELAPPAEQDFVPLFNGKDLTGWSTLNLNSTKNKSASVWKVDAARQILLAQAGDFQELQSDRDYKDFTLKLDWRFAPGGNVGANGSGVVVRSKGLNTTGRLANLDPQGVEIDLRAKANQSEEKQMGTGCFFAYGTKLTNHRGKTDGERERSLGWLKEPATRYDGEWNSCEITCQGDRIRVWMNGELINEGWEADELPGRITLRSQNTAVEFRNIRIKELVPSAEQGFVPLFNGKDLTGWETDSKFDPFSVDGEGNLVAAANSPGSLQWLYTKQSYKDFVLRLEFLVIKPPPALTNSGIAIRALPGPTGSNGERLRVALRSDPNLRPHNAAVVYSPTGALEPKSPPALKPAGEWNSLELDVRGPRVRVAINGREVNDADLSTIDRSKLAPKEKAWAESDLDRKEGRIGLQSFRGQVKFRNIRVKALADAHRRAPN